MKLLMNLMVMVMLTACSTVKLTDQDNSGLITQDIRVIVDHCEKEYFMFEYEEYNAFHEGCYRAEFFPTANMRCTDTQCSIRKEDIK